MKKAFLLITILFCCVFSVVAQEQIEREEYDVYNAVFGDDSYQHVIFNFTALTELNPASKFIRKLLRQELSIVKPDTLKSFNNRNEKSFELKDEFGRQPTVKLVNNEDMQPFLEMIKKDNDNEIAVQNAFLEKYGSMGLVTLSRVGFNKSKTQALVLLSNSAGFCGTCNESYYVVLSKENGRWEIKKKVMPAIN